jgi:hypothetical protein
MKSHLWAALAVGVYAMDKVVREER